MPIFRRKPTEVEAIKYIGVEDGGDLNFETSPPEWLTSIIERWGDQPGRYQSFGGVIRLVTHKGNHVVSPGDWIIKNSMDEIYPLKDDIFLASYDFVKS